MSKHTSIGKLFVAKRKRRKLRADMDKISPDSILSDELVSRRLDPYSNLFSHPPDVEDLTTRFLPAYGIYFTAEEALKSKLPIQKLAVVVSAREQRDRLLSYWASASIVLALLSSMSVATYFLPPDFTKLHEKHNDHIQAFAFLNGAAFLMDFNGLILTTIYIACMNQLPTDLAVIEYIQKYSKVLPLPTTFLVSGAICYVSTVAYGGLIFYDFGWGCIAVTAILMTIFILIMLLWINMQAFSIRSCDDAIKLKMDMLGKVRTSSKFKMEKDDYGNVTTTDDNSAF